VDQGKPTPPDRLGGHPGSLKGHGCIPKASVQVATEPFTLGAGRASSIERARVSSKAISRGPLADARAAIRHAAALSRPRNLFVDAVRMIERCPCPALHFRCECESNHARITLLVSSLLKSVLWRSSDRQTKWSLSIVRSVLQAPFCTASPAVAQRATISGFRFPTALHSRAIRCFQHRLRRAAPRSGPARGPRAVREPSRCPFRGSR
jgi:hypothetical protein